MNATITYTLSTEGQRAALAAGLAATTSQTAVIEVPAEALDLFAISNSGALSADLREGAVRSRHWNTSWDYVAFDALLTAEAAISFLRARVEGRAAILAAEAVANSAKKAEEAEKAIAQRLADILTLKVAITNDNLDGLTIYSRTVRVGQGGYAGREYSDDDAKDAEIAPLVREIIEIQAERDAKRKAKEAAEAALQSLIDSIPAAPPERPVTLQADGRFSVVVPDPPHSGEWGKHVTSVDAAGQNGTAFDGPWLKCGVSTVLAAGEMIVVGSKWYEGSRKNGVTKKTRDIYLVTPAGLIGLLDNSPAKGAELLTKDPSERVMLAMEAALKGAEVRISKFDALDAEAYAPVAETVATRRAAWVARKAALEAAIERASAPLPITNVAEAAAAIIGAGYKALAAINHPDRGGSAVVMGLLTDARNQLREILALATEVTA
jgi:hypothetical protein